VKELSPYKEYVLYFKEHYKEVIFEEILFNGREVRMAIMPNLTHYGLLRTGEVIYRDTLKICPAYDDGKDGYLMIKLYPDIPIYRNGKKMRITFRVNILMGMAIFGPIPEGLQIDHINGERANNHWTNLRDPVTRKENNDFKKQRDAHFLTNHEAPKKTKESNDPVQIKKEEQKPINNLELFNDEEIDRLQPQGGKKI